MNQKRRILSMSFDDGLIKQEIKKEYLQSDAPDLSMLIDIFRQFLIILTYDPELANKVRLVSNEVFEAEFSDSGFFDNFS